MIFTFCTPGRWDLRRLILSSLTVDTAPCSNLFMSFCRKMDHTVNPVKDFMNKVLIADIAVDKLIPLIIFDGLQVVEVSSIGEFVQVYDVDLRIFSQEIVNKIAPYEARSTSH